MSNWSYSSIHAQWCAGAGYTHESVLSIQEFCELVVEVLVACNQSR